MLQRDLPEPCAMLGQTAEWRLQWTPQPSHTDGRRRAATQLPAGRGGRCGAGGVLPLGDLAPPLGHIGLLRIQRAPLRKGRSRVGPLPRC
jgi:hypothetical protein